MRDIINYENIKRFDGFSDIYNDNRPVPPSIITRIITKYLERTPDVVVDIGCGTGLSTGIWAGLADTVIGIEPNDDMRGEAKKTADGKNIYFKKGVSNNTGLDSDYADIVTVSQAFHWFDISSALGEAYRIIKPGGIFAVFDCDLPPAIDMQIEMLYNKLIGKCNKICLSEKNHAVKNDKSSYIKHFKEFGKFRFIKEVLCHSIEKCDSGRIKGLTLSQGSLQTALKINNSIREEINDFFKFIDIRLTRETDMILSYRIRICVK
ncbi:MAG: class I SAM-dependent methyltransferase [Eubacterium sp.]|nr:class I SAM-dependent methyltransferase [Eubacterium sp.]